MPFTMSGNNDGWSFNRFDEYEEKLQEKKECGDKPAKKKSDRPNLADVYGADRRNTKPLNTEEVEHVEEGIDFKGAKRIDDARAKAQAEKDKKNPSGKDRRLAMGKFRPGASHEERAEGHRDNMREKGTSPIKNGEKMFEDLQATGLFTVEEIEALVEAACGAKGYQEGGEVKADKEDCDKCKGKGCDHCKDKKKSNKKPDYIDADKDGDKEEPMVKALKEKGLKEDYGYSKVYESKSEESLEEGIGLAGAYSAVKAASDHEKRSLDKSKMSAGAKYAMRKADERKHDGHSQDQHMTASQRSIARADKAKYDSAEERVRKAKMKEGGPEAIKKYNIDKAAKISGDSNDRVSTNEEVKMDPMVEAAVAALAPLLAKAGAATKAAGAAGAVKGAGAAGAVKGSGLAAKAGSAAKGMAKDMAMDAAMDLGSSALDGIKSIPGKIAKSVGDAARQTQSSEEPES